MLERVSPASPVWQPKRPFKRWSKLGSQLFLVVVTLLTGLTAALLVWNAASILLYPRLTSSSCNADTLLVMGAAQYNGTPSPAFQRRLDHAYRLFNEGCAQQIVVTGGRLLGDLYSEGGSGARYLAARGVPASALASERRSTTSYENLVNSKPLVTGKQLTIVTDDLHAYRTRVLAQRLGYTAELAPVYSPYGRAQYLLRELLAVTAYRLGYFH